MMLALSVLAGVVAIAAAAPWYVGVGLIAAGVLLWLTS